MSLEVQIQSLVVSFLAGLLYGFGYGFYNRCVLKLSRFIFRMILEMTFNICFITLYFYTVLLVNDGKFYFYYFIVMALGVFYYLVFLSKGYLRMIEKIMDFFHFLFLPFYFINKKIRGILSHIKWVGKHGKQANKQTKTK